jgi:hypothetical protein
MNTRLEERVKTVLRLRVHELKIKNERLRAVLYTQTPIPKSAATRIQQLRDLSLADNSLNPIATCFLPSDLTASIEGNSKLIYMLRHGQGEHNAARDEFEAGRCAPEKKKGWW